MSNLNNLILNKHRITKIRKKKERNSTRLILIYLLNLTMDAIE